MLALSILAAYALDLAIGDPFYAWHPVRLIGAMIDWYERKLRLLIPNERAGGIYLALGVPIDIFLITVLVLWITRLLHPFLAFGIATFLIYCALSVKDMADHADAVRQSLEQGDLVKARLALSRIVGRDTGRLSAEEVVRATIESTAESTVDGILSPLFYAALGGAPLALGFKAVSTLDSMVGYRNERYGEFGWASAKLDDLLNYLPSRTAPCMVALGALAAGAKSRSALALGFRDGARNPSVNSGFPEASFAGALGVRLGGVNYYGRKPVEKPILHPEGREARIEDIPRAIRLMYYTSFFGLLASLTVCYLVWGGAG